MRLLESKRYRDDLKKAISNTDISELNNKSIFITGGLGLICSAIVDVLLIGCIDNNIIYILYEVAVSIAVPFFFLSTGYLIGRKIQNKKEFDDVLVERQQKKVIRYYVIWTIVYLPLTILGFYKAGDGFVKSFVQFIRNVFFQGENYYSWPLWYLLSAVYGLTILKLLVESQKETKKFNFYSIIIIFFCSNVDIRREDWKQLEEDFMAKLENCIYLFDKH